MCVPLFSRPTGQRGRAEPRLSVEQSRVEHRNIRDGARKIVCCDGNSGDSLILRTVDHSIGDDAIRVPIDEFGANAG